MFGISSGRTRFAAPDGPVQLLTDPRGNEIALMEQTRPGILEREDRSSERIGRGLRAPR